MKRKNWCFFLAALGLVMVAAGLLLLKTGKLADIAAPYLCVGVGCGALGHGAGEILKRRAEKSSPEASRQMEIEKNDERNVALRDKAQARAYNVMLPVFGALFIAFGLMGVELKVLLLLIAAYLFVCGCGIYYRIKYEKEM